MKTTKENITFSKTFDIESNPIDVKFKNIPIFKYGNGDTYYATASSTAKVIRQLIKQAFPTIKARVISDTFSMGDSVTVYIQNPQDVNDETMSQLKDIVKWFQGGSFDAMTDMYNYHSSAGLQLEYQGKTVEFTAKYTKVIQSPMYGTPEYNTYHNKQASDLLYG